MKKKIKKWLGVLEIEAVLNYPNIEIKKSPLSEEIDKKIDKGCYAECFKCGVLIRKNKGIAEAILEKDFEKDSESGMTYDGSRLYFGSLPITPNESSHTVYFCKRCKK